MARKKFRFEIDRSFGTVPVRDKETGRFQGRKGVKGQGDRTTERRVVSPKKYKGEIYGRTSPIPIRGDKRKRAHLRRTI